MKYPGFNVGSSSYLFNTYRYIKGMKKTEAAAAADAMARSGGGAGSRGGGGGREGCVSLCRMPIGQPCIVNQ
jgi:hypothetical protein